MLKNLFTMIDKGIREDENAFISLTACKKYFPVTKIDLQNICGHRNRCDLININAYKH